MKPVLADSVSLFLRNRNKTAILSVHYKCYQSVSKTWWYVENENCLHSFQTNPPILTPSGLLDLTIPLPFNSFRNIGLHITPSGFRILRLIETSYSNITYRWCHGSLKTTAIISLSPQTRERRVSITDLRKAFNKIWHANWILEKIQSITINLIKSKLKYRSRSYRYAYRNV